ncbi:MAG: hypothetical protein GY862_04520, partial [Gammaproteobacteria bacterium]|nr:hypothetical protein [Gammaproteobacteria bacterium]
MLLTWAKQTQLRQASFIHLAVIFDPFIEPAPAGICREIAFGNVQCDWSGIPPYRQPGIHIFNPFFRAVSADEQVSRVTCENGAAQKVHPTVPGPALFMERLLSLAGTESAVFNLDGTFDMVYEGQNHHLTPDFYIHTDTGAENPGAVFSADGTVLAYTFEYGDRTMTSLLSMSPPVPETIVIDVENLGALSLETLALLRPQDLAALDVALFVRQPAHYIARFFTNLDPVKITVADALILMPTGWFLSDTGALVAPPGTRLSLKEFAHALILPLPDMNSVFGLGGVSGGSSFSEGINEILATEGLAEFTLSQQPNGILLVKGTGQYAGAEYAFIPDVGNIVQAGEEIPVGLSVQEGGWYVLTVPGGQQFIMVPAPKDPADL